MYLELYLYVLIDRVKYLYLDLYLSLKVLGLGKYFAKVHYFTNYIYSSIILNTRITNSQAF